MIYSNIQEGIFIERPNRFIAHVLVDGKMEICHVKNTGRCKELLVKGRKVYLEKSDNPNRKTKFSLVTVDKDGLLVNMDSQAPNTLVKEWLISGHVFDNIEVIKPEYTHGNSRFDFMVQTSAQKHLIEVKGVTLENNGVVSFPDAPTKRGTKHIRELINSKQEGFIPHIFFVIQLESAYEFVPNFNNDPDFSLELTRAYNEQVDIKTLTCKVSKETVKIISDENIFRIK